MAIGGTHQAGEVWIGGHCAALWSGTASSFTNLNPAGCGASTIYAIAGEQQVGYVLKGNYRAALWAGTAASVVDLNPEGASSSTAYAAFGTQQAGVATISGKLGAALWSGTATSFVDLKACLGSTYRDSGAYGLWAEGGTTYAAGSATEVSSGKLHAILWIIQNPPATLPALMVVDAKCHEAEMVMSLAWTNSGLSCELQASTVLTQGWTCVNTPCITNGNLICTTVTNTAAAQFFRLRGL
jgi:hypothetical protein